MQHPISHYVLSATLFVAFIATALPSSADDNQIRIPRPPMPRIVLPAAPPMIWLPAPKVYVAHKSPYPIFYQSGHYYLHDHDAWFIGPGYGGPWKAVSSHRVPKNLRGFRKHHWGRYQNEAAQHFRDDDRDDRHEHSPFYGRREAHEPDRLGGRMAARLGTAAALVVITHCSL